MQSLTYITAERDTSGKGGRLTSLAPLPKISAVSCNFVDRSCSGGKKARNQTKTLLRLSLRLFVIGLFLSTETSAATVTNRVTGAANWNTAATWIQNRTGTVTFTNLSKNVTGVGTLFTSELTMGDSVILQTSPGIVRGVVASITSDTQLVLQANATATISGAYGRQQVPGASDDVVIGNTNLASRPGRT